MGYIRVDDEDLLVRLREEKAKRRLKSLGAWVSKVMARELAEEQLQNGVPTPKSSEKKATGLREDRRTAKHYGLLDHALLLADDDPVPLYMAEVSLRVAVEMVKEYRRRVAPTPKAPEGPQRKPKTQKRTGTTD